MAMTAAGELGAGGQRDAQHGFGGDRLAIGGAADAIGAEQATVHD
jgi:hypothetical protein